MVRCGSVWFDEVRFGPKGRCGLVGLGMASSGRVGSGMVRATQVAGEVRSGKVGRGTLRFAQVG